MKYFEIAKRLSLEKYLFLGQVMFDDFNQVVLIEENKKISFSLNKEKKIQEIWEKHLLDNPNDFDGAIGSIMEISEKQGILKIRFRRGRFSQFYSTFDKRKERINLSSNPLDKGTCLPISFGAVTTTQPSLKNPNGCILFAKRTNTAFDPEVITLLPGGYFDPEKDNSIFSTIFRELLEETGIVMNNIKVSFLGIVYNSYGSRQPLIACHLNIPTIKEKIELNIDEETEEVFFIDNDIDSVREFIRNKKIAVHDAWKIILYFNKMLNN
ncbi:hypothetical protein DS65_00455 [Mesotoga sp. SC_4PWL113PWK15]|jgi:8-oxo-dGTP pyrophosphatase MutT (NUDIX family)|nr:hypothetical protein DS65_00455 [Mesotoga sp. SC_4PWL113PWK15]